MRLQGKIARWDDQRGFGFIAWHADGSEVFVHIKAFPRAARRPVVGDIVTYEIGKGEKGRSRAEKVRFARQPEPTRRAPGRLTRGAFPVAFAFLVVLALLVSAWFGRISWLVVAAVLLLSLVTFLAYAWDKSSARLELRRTRESTLQVLSLAGGWPGALAAQRLVRHKSSKQEFLSEFWFMVLLNVIALGYLVWSGKDGLVNQFIDALWQRLT